MNRVVYARIPDAPKTASPVPHLTSLYHFDNPGNYGDRKYPGNCGGGLIKDLLTYFKPTGVFDPMTGSGTCDQVCKELEIYCHASDLRNDIDAADAASCPSEAFDFCWIHPPYWRQKVYSNDPRDLSRAPTLQTFIERYRLVIENCTDALCPGGKLAILMGDYNDREVGQVPLVFYTKYLALKAGLKMHCTDIIRFSHHASSSKKEYRSSFIPGLHDVCMIFEKPRG